jgi:hypothetical protein
LPDAVFTEDEPPRGRVTATELARGPWDPDAQHGGAPAALLMRAFERLPGGEEMNLARVTYELLRPVPLGELEVRAEVVRPGRRVHLLEASLLTPAGVELVRARALKVARAEAVLTDPAAAPPADRPVDGRPNDFPTAGLRMFSTDALDIRLIAGGFTEPGPATAWFRFKVPLVAGERASPLQRLAAAADFGNGVASVLPWDQFVFINPDLTVYLLREPVGDWIRLQSETRIARDGIGLSESVIGDMRGLVGRATQALVVSRRVAT